MVSLFPSFHAVFVQFKSILTLQPINDEKGTALMIGKL